MTEFVPAKTSGKAKGMVGYAGEAAQVVRLGEVEISPEAQVATGLPELDRVLGGGMVPGSVVLLGGDPGIGKSTLLLQTLTELSGQMPTLYVTGEESVRQIGLRAQRLGLKVDALQLLTETAVELVLEQAQRLRPQVMVIDSIQTIHTEDVG